MEQTGSTLSQLMFSLIEVWKSSGQSQKDFCREKDLALSKFQYWYKKYQQSGQPDGDPFMAVTVRKPGTRPVGPGSMEIYWPDGRRLIFHQEVEVSFLRALLA
jgi:hypothetical protein